MKAFYLFEINFFFFNFRKENDKAFFFNIFFFFLVERHNYHIFKKKEENTLKKKNPNVVKILFLKKTFFLYTIFRILGRKGKHFVWKIHFLEKTFFDVFKKNPFWKHFWKRKRHFENKSFIIIIFLSFEFHNFFRKKSFFIFVLKDLVEKMRKSFFFLKRYFLRIGV